MNDKISIVVAIYNVKLYLENCIDSILSQSYQNIEVILVDDGSTDGSGLICDLYKKMDYRVKVIHQENKGVTAARKSGVQLATGRYIGFVDGDDWVEKEMYGSLLEDMQYYDAEIVVSGLYRDNDEGPYAVWKGSNFPQGVYLASEESNPIYLDFFTNGVQNFNGSVVNKLFSSKLLTDILMEIDDRITYGEDIACSFPCILFAKSVYITNKIFYHGYDRSDSCTHTRNNCYYEQLNLLYKSLFENFSKHKCSKKLLQDLDAYMCNEIVAGFSRFSGNDYLANYYIKLEENQSNRKQVVLYGAGKVGRSYYRQLEATGAGDIVLWVDKDWKRYREDGWNVDNIEKINLVEYDVIIVAIKEEKTAVNIIKELKELGIKENKVVWKNPMRPYEYFKNNHMKK